MTKGKPPRKKDGPPPLPDDLWRPQRPMGLARTIAKSGNASRPQAEKLIQAGRVRLDGEVVTDPGATVLTDSVILIDDEPLVEAPRRYYAFHKPVRVRCSPSEPGSQRLVSEFLPDEVPGLQTAGRLDVHTSGLMLVSNDTNWLSLAAGRVILEKEYWVLVKGRLTEVQEGVIAAGINLPGDGHIKPIQVNILEARPEQTTLRLVITEGRNRQVRRIFHSLRHEVIILRRVRIGPIRLASLPAGSLRPLTDKEIDFVRRAPRPRPKT